MNGREEVTAIYTSIAIDSRRSPKTAAWEACVHQGAWAQATLTRGGEVQISNIGSMILERQRHVDRAKKELCQCKCGGGCQAIFVAPKSVRGEGVLVKCFVNSRRTWWESMSVSSTTNVRSKQATRFRAGRVQSLTRLDVPGLGKPQLVRPASEIHSAPNLLSPAPLASIPE